MTAPIRDIHGALTRRLSRKHTRYRGHSVSIGFVCPENQKMKQSLPMEMERNSSPRSHPMKSKRVRYTRSRSVPVLRQALRISTTITKDNNPVEKALLRIETKQRLLNLYQCLKAISQEGEKLKRNLSFDEQGQRFYVEVKGKKTKRAHNENVYSLISQASELGIIFFVDEEGTCIELKKIIVLFKEVFVKNDFDKEVLSHELRLFEELVQQNQQIDLDPTKIGNLSFPKLYKNLPENEKICIQLLQRLYPSEECHESGLIHPLTLLNTYRRFVDDEMFFDLVGKVLNFPDKFMPLIQKFRLLNFCWIWLTFESYLNPSKRKDKLQIFRKLMTISISSSHKIIQDYACELLEKVYHFTFGDRPVIHSGPISLTIRSKLENIAKGMSRDKDEVVTLFANDLQLISIQYTLEVESLDMLLPPDKSEGLIKLADYFNRISYLTEREILSPSEWTIGIEEKKKAAKRLATFFCSLANEMKTRNDFLSSMAIYASLIKLNIKQQFFKEVEFKDLQDLFLIWGNYHELQLRCQELYKENVPYIPYHGLILSHIQHIKDGNKDFLSRRKPKRHGVNIRKLGLLSRELAGFSNVQKQLFVYLNSQRNLTMQTDLEAVLNHAEPLNDCAIEACINNIFPNLKTA